MTYQPNRGGPQQNRPAQGREAEVPAGKLVPYYDANGNMREALVDADAMECAKKFRGIASTQLRRFYEHVIGLRRRLDECGESEKAGEFDKLRPEFKMLKAKAAYAVKRDRNTEAAMRLLLEFFSDHTLSVKNTRDFNTFCKHFEAVIAFHKFYAEDKQ